MNDYQPPVGDHSKTAGMPSVPYDIGLSKDWVAQGPVTLIIRDNDVFGGGSYSIRAANGNNIFDVDIPFASFSHRRTFYSSAGHKLLFHVREDQLSIPRSWYFENDAGQNVCDVLGHFTMFDTPKLDAVFTNVVGPRPERIMLQVRGDFMARTAEIYWNDIPVATIRGSYGSFGRMIMGQSQYYVQILPGVDIALIAGIVVAVNGILHRRKRRRRGGVLGAMAGGGAVGGMIGGAAC